MKLQNPGECANTPGAVANLRDQVDMTQAIRACLRCAIPLTAHPNRKYCGDECRSADYEAKAKPCAFDGCSKKAKTGGLCSGHAEQRRLRRPLTALRSRPGYKNGIRCAFEICTKYARSNGLCWGHAEQHSRGVPLTILKARLPSNIHAERDDHGRKYCAGCTSWLDLDCFFKVNGKADGYHYRCKECSHARYVEREFNLPQGWYRQQLDAQGGACAICRIPASQLTKKLVVDHDHACCPGKSKSCGKCVRSLLCGQCNIALGALKDRTDLFLVAANYLEGHRERRMEELPAA